MLLSNRQRKYMSLLLCLLMIFTIFSWNVRQVHAVAPAAVPVVKVVGGILVGVGVVALTSDGQDQLAQYVYDHSSESTKNKFIAMAGLMSIGEQYFLQLGADVFNDIKSVLDSVIQGSNANIQIDNGIKAEVSQLKAYSNGSFSSTYGFSLYQASFYTSSGNFVAKNINNYSEFSLDYNDVNSVIFSFQYFTDPIVLANTDLPLVVRPADTTVAYTMALNPEWQRKNSTPPPFPLIVDPGTLTLPQTQDALYDGVPIAPEADVPYTPGATSGTLEGNVGALVGEVGLIRLILRSIGFNVQDIWLKILEMLESMVAFFQAIMEWVNSFMSELALTIEAVLTEFFTVPTPFVLPTDMFDGMLDDLLDKTGLSAFDQTFSRLQNLQTGYGSPPEITINLHELMAATSHVGSGFSVPLANKESLVIDFSKLEEVEFWNMSLIDLIRALLSLSMVGMTFNYIYRKIIPDKVIE